MHLHVFPLPCVKFCILKPKLFKILMNSQTSTMHSYEGVSAELNIVNWRRNLATGALRAAFIRRQFAIANGMAYGETGGRKL